MREPNDHSKVQEIRGNDIPETQKQETFKDLEKPLPQK